MQTLKVDVGHTSYPIQIGPGLLGDGAMLESLVAGRAVCIVTNTTVAGLYLGRLQATLAGRRAAAAPRTVCCALPDGEQYKTLETVGRVFDALVGAGLNRDCIILDLGEQGGRQLHVIDAALIAGGKNLIGAFHQPIGVVADTDTLKSLPERELRAGLAEVIKYGCISDRLLFDWLELNMEHLVQRDPAALAYAIGRSCEIKAEVVARDERESNVRALLNFGHTFGHAIESATGYSTYLHGEAVGLGMLMAASLSHRLGWIDATEQARIRELLMRAGLPTEAPRIGADRALGLMRMDKKVLAGAVRLVLLEGLGRAVVSATYGRPLLEATLAEYCG